LPKKWDMEADVVVAGFGSAGAGAALEAAGAGASVLIMEKMTEKLSGGDSSCFGGNFMPGDADAWVASSLGHLPKETAKARGEWSH
jgi:succinate dehydrogenase/fumarate reductase flavoprotein subunit